MRERDSRGTPARQGMVRQVMESPAAWVLLGGVGGDWDRREAGMRSAGQRSRRRLDLVVIDGDQRCTGARRRWQKREGTDSMSGGADRFAGCAEAFCKAYGDEHGLGTPGRREMQIGLAVAVDWRCGLAEDGGVCGVVVYGGTRGGVF